MKEALKKRILKICPLEKEVLEQFLDCIKFVEWPKKKLLCEAGKTAKKLYYIVKGAARIQVGVWQNVHFDRQIT